MPRLNQTTNVSDNARQLLSGSRYLGPGFGKAVSWHLVVSHLGGRFRLALSSRVSGLAIDQHVIPIASNRRNPRPGLVERIPLRPNQPHTKT